MAEDFTASPTPAELADASAATPSQGAPPQTTPATGTARGPIPAGINKNAAEIQEEVGDRDITYIRDRIVFRYDYKLQDGPTETNRFRLKLLYAFGSHQRFGIAADMPVMYKSAPSGTAWGSGDIEIIAGGLFYKGERLRIGATFQVTPQTSSENLLGGSTTTIKPAWGFIYVFSDRCELTSAFYYKQSIHTVRGTPTKQFEPDITLNVRVLRATWFVEYDSYYDFSPQEYAQTMKTGLSRNFGKNHNWVASAYYSTAINDYGTKSQYKYNPGFDLTWYPFPNH